MDTSFIYMVSRDQFCQNFIYRPVTCTHSPRYNKAEPSAAKKKNESERWLISLNPVRRNWAGTSEALSITCLYIELQTRHSFGNKSS